MTKNLFLLLSLLVLSSCKKNYKYIEKIETQSISGLLEKEDKVSEIKAENDTAAYLQAHLKFLISQEVQNDMNKASGVGYSNSLSFMLFNDKGENITNLDFKNKDKRISEISSSISSLDSLSYAVTPEINRTKIDSAKIKELKSFFKEKKDEFSPQGISWIKPKSSPMYTNQNGIYSYFKNENNVVSNFRFRVQFYSKDWLFFSKIQFSIDGTAYEYIPSKTETDSGNGGYIWEWCDQEVSGNNDKKLLLALANAKTAKMKFIGRQYYDIKNISKEQITSIKRTIDYYKALGGNF